MLLYKFDKNCKHELNKKFNIETFKPCLFNLQKHTNFSIIYLYWYILTRGRYRIIYVKHNNEIIHYTHVIPYIYKFNFLKKNDYEIGPCMTNKNYRGEGIYKVVLTKVVQKFKEKNRNFYMIVSKKNISSIKGIEKSGFKLVGEVKKSPILGIYNEV